MQAIAHGSMRYSLAVWMCIPKPCPSPLGALSAIPCVSAEKLSPPYIAAVLQSVGHGENNELVLRCQLRSRRHLTCSANVGRTRNQIATQPVRRLRHQRSVNAPRTTMLHVAQVPANGIQRVHPTSPKLCIITVGQQNRPTTRDSREEKPSRPPYYPHNPFTDGLNMPTPESPPPRKRGISFGSTCGGNECHWQPQFLASALYYLSPGHNNVAQREKLATFRWIPIR
ncbi:hypothetical protein HDV57DRAFT_137789 [Trichoderma longibrachiatum]